jgi:hypothetical protein
MIVLLNYIIFYRHRHYVLLSIKFGHIFYLEIYTPSLIQSDFSSLKLAVEILTDNLTENTDS